MSEIKTKQNTTKYFYYYLNTNEMRNVSKKSFLSGDYPVIRDEYHLIKLVGLSQGFNKKRLAYLLFETHKFKQEGFVGDCMDAMSLVRDIIEILGKCKRGLETLKSEFEMDLILNIISLVVRFKRNCELGLSITDLILSLTDFYLVVRRIKAKFNPEMIEEFCLASISMFLPPPLFEIIKRINVFSHAKLSEDISGLHRLFSLVFSGIDFIISLLPINTFTKKMRELLLSLGNFGTHAHLYKMKKLIEDKDVGEKLLRSTFRETIKRFYAEVNHGDFITWSRRSPAVAAIYMDFQKLKRRIDAFENCSRQEPIGIVFQGPPGCGKSRAMNGVLQCLPMTRYAHQVKDINDGKDFYDAYENESIFYMDDVGQQGIAQWRTFINMISEVKYPLDCARAENKDTKFFNSEIILATTNEFMNLSNLTRQDCIRELPALWRRCHVIDFSEVLFSGVYTGVAKWKYYDLTEQKFKIGYPEHLRECMSGLSPVFSLTGVDIDFYAWISKHVVKLRNVSKMRMASNNLTPSQIEMVRTQLDEFKMEGGDSFLSNLMGMWSMPTKSDTVSSFEDIDSLNTEFDLDVELQRLKEELADLSTTDTTLYIQASPLAYFKAIITQGFSWIVSKIRVLLSTITENDLFLEISIYIFSMLLCYGVNYIVSSCVQKKQKLNYSIESELADKFDLNGLNTMHASIRNNLREVVVVAGKHTTHVVGLLSGHNVVVPAHCVHAGDMFITVYGNKGKNHIIYDKVRVTVLYENRNSDVAVLSLPKNIATVFKNMGHFFRTKTSRNNYVLISPYGVMRSCRPTVLQSRDAILYRVPLNDSFFETRIEGDAFMYDVHGKGLCGSLVVDNEGILGMHVAGCDEDGTGVAMKWGEVDILKIGNILLNDKCNFQLPLHDKEIENASVIKLDVSLPVSVASSSSLGRSPLYGLFPITRKPANLVKYGKCTIKDVAKKSFGHTQSVRVNELNFGKDVVRHFLKFCKHRILSEGEIVGGTRLLAGLNKESSNGYKCKPLKTDYIDFENKSFLSQFKNEINVFENTLECGPVDWEKLVWVEALKDELRNVEKDGEPRSFRVGTIHHQVLMKKYFGWLVEHLMENRRENGIMVGINPFTEWQQMYDTLKATKGVFAGDIAKWDGSMNNMVQDAIKEVILEFVPLNYQQVSDVLLENAIRSIVAVQDDTYITTHSMPSGHYLTAILNSLVNRFYTAMWYTRETGCVSTTKFLREVVDFVYGDDKVVGINDNENVLNAISMTNFFESMGMGFTDSLKNPILEPFQDLQDITFLKRYFRYHDELGKIVCPLELRTLQSGISFFDYKKEMDTVMLAKIDTYQREIYLWPDRVALLEDFLMRLRSRGVEIRVLTEAYLKNLYTDPDIDVLKLSWGGSQYM